MKLISEHVENVKVLTETAESGKKSFYLTGPFIQTELPNKNGRIYPKNMMESVVEKYVDSHVKNNRAYGELNHPTGPAINLDRVCIIIKELNWDKNLVHGKALVTESTPMGGIVKGLIESGGSLGVSTRGMGDMEEKDGFNYVKPGYHLATAADVVADPSAQSAFVKGILENVEWIYDASKDVWVQETLYETKKSLRKMTMDELEQNKFTVFESFLSSLTVGQKILK